MTLKLWWPWYRDIRDVCDVYAVHNDCDIHGVHDGLDEVDVPFMSMK